MNNPFSLFGYRTSIYEIRKAFRRTIRKLLGSIKLSFVERLRTCCILKQEFSDLYKLPIFDNRKILWTKCIESIGSDTNVTYIEFGVFKAETLKYFASKNLNTSSLFIGLDTFTGYPVPFAHLPKGYRDCGGNPPSNDGDARMQFLKGLFTETAEKLHSALVNRANNSTFVVYFDSDTYESTLFCLTQLGRYRMSFFAIFDEFLTDECRALYDYMNSFDYNAKPIASAIRSWDDKLFFIGDKSKAGNLTSMFFLSPK